MSRDPQENIYETFAGLAACCTNASQSITACNDT